MKKVLFIALLGVLLVSGRSSLSGPVETTPVKTESRHFQNHVVDQAEAEIWIAADRDKPGTGTRQDPFSSLETALPAIRALAGKKSVTVFLSGTFSMSNNKTILLDGLSGTEEKPIIFSRIPDQKEIRPIFDGARSMTAWTPLTESVFWKKASSKEKEKIQKDLVSKIWVHDLSGMKKNQLGDAVSLGSCPELFALNTPQKLAQWPNKGFTNAGKVFGKIVTKGYNGSGFKDGIFEYLDSRQAKWANESDPRIFGYWFYDWSEGYQGIKSIDTAAKTIALMPPLHLYGYRKGFRYRGINLLCELDEPGEFYLDRTNMILFWYPQSSDLVKKETVLTEFSSPYMLELRNCSYVSMIGMKFRYGRQGAVLMKQGNHCLLLDCEFTGFGTCPVSINGGTDNGIACSLLEKLGAGAISLSGGDRKTLTPCRNFAENNRVRYFSRLKRTYAPAVSMNGCGLRTAHNIFEESSSSAMSLSGNDFLIEYNIVRNVVKESDDQGGIDTWYNPTYLGNVIRYNYWGDIVGGTVCGAAGIRLDDIISGFHIYGNIFERCGAVHFGAIQIHGGKDNIIEDNLFVDCFAAVSFSRWGARYTKAIAGEPASQSKISLNSRMYKEVDIRSDLWKKRYPSLANIGKDPDVNTIRNNLAVNCQQLFRNDGGVQILSNNIQISAKGATPDSILKGSLPDQNKIQRPPFKEMGNYPFKIEYRNRSGK